MAPPPAERGEVVCDHRIPAVLRTSRSEKNPGRTYWTCSRRRGRTCGFFRWGDAPGFAQHVAPPPRPEKDPSAITDAERFAAWECEQGSELWLATRRGRLTATGFGPIFWRVAQDLPIPAAPRQQQPAPAAAQPAEAEPPLVAQSYASPAPPMRPPAGGGAGLAVGLAVGVVVIGGGIAAAAIAMKRR